MSYGRRYFGLETILNLYKNNKISIIEAIKLLRAIVRGIGLKEAKEIIDNFNNKEI